MILKEEDIEINFSEYSHHIPPQIPLSVQNATSKFLGNRSIRVAEMGDWEELREQASRIRKHTLINLSQYLTQLEENILELGGYVHWAKDAEEAREIILEIASKNQVRNVVKAKSMATEEIGLNHAFLQNDINVTETDLGEFIIQLAESSPSHIIDIIL